MSKQTSIFAAGWTAQKQEKLKSTKLPDKTRCKACHKIKTIANFSNKQQQDLKQRIAGPSGEKASLPTTETIKCRACTGGQVHELTCSICDEVKGLQAFTKAQRKNPDNARCILCVHSQLDRRWAGETPEGETANQDSNSEFDDSDDESDGRSNPYAMTSDSADHEINSAISNFGAVSLTERQGNAYGGKSVISGKSLQTFASHNAGTMYTGYDAQGNAHRRVRPVSTADSDDDDDDDSVEIVTSPLRSGRSTLMKPGRRNFAKPARGPSPPPPPYIEALKASATGRTVSYSDDEASDDDWGVIPEKADGAAENASKSGI